MSLITVILFILLCWSLPLQEAWSKNVIIRVGDDGSLIIQEKGFPLPQRPLPLANNNDYKLVPSEGKMYIIKSSGQKFSETTSVILSKRRNPTDKDKSPLTPTAQRSDGISEIIHKYALQHGVDSRLIQLVIKHESGFNSQAVSPKGARGLMQLMPGTATMLGVSDPFDAEQNIAGGIKYLKHCLERFNNDVSLALAAYNAGPENVNRYQGVPPFNETRNYVANIMRDYTGQAPAFVRPASDASRLASSPPPNAAGDNKKLSKPLHPLACLPPLYVGGSGAISISQVGKLKIINVTEN